MKAFLTTTAIRVIVVPLVGAGIAYAALTALGGTATETSPRSGVFDVTESPGITDPTTSPDPAPAAVVPVAPAPAVAPAAVVPAPAPAVQEAPAADALPEGWIPPVNPGEPPRAPIGPMPEAPCMPGEGCAATGG